MGGKDEVDVIKQDLLWETAKDISSNKNLVHEEGVINKRLAGILDGLVSLVEKDGILSSGDRQHGGSNPLGYGEIGVYHSLYTIKEIKPGFLDNFPALIDFVNATSNTSSINNYLRSCRRLPLTQNELGKGHTGIGGYVYLK